MKMRFIRYIFMYDFQTIIQEQCLVDTYLFVTSTRNVCYLKKGL